MTISTYIKKVVKNLSDSFYNEYEYWIYCYTTFDEWTEKLYHKNIKPQKAAAIIERSFMIYKLWMK